MFTIRTIEESDAAAVLEVYAPFVKNTSITFEYEVPEISEFQNRILTISKTYPWLVLLHNNKIAGYAYGSEFRHKTAYQWSPESTIYMDANIHGKGVGKISYQAVFDILKLQGFVNVYAGMTLPNDKSKGLHHSLGFEEIGVYNNVGFKKGAWHSTLWFALTLQTHGDEPSKPIPFPKISPSEEVRNIISEANQILKQIEI